jgi:hypothetical protein
MVTGAASTVTVTLTFSVPVIISGLIPLVVEDHVDTPVQTVVDSTHVTLVYDATCAAKDWSLAGGIPQVATFQGGALVPDSGTF